MKSRLRLRQKGGSMCPPGVFCLSNTALLALVVAAVLIAGCFIYMAFQTKAQPVNIKLEIPNQPRIASPAVRQQLAAPDLPPEPVRRGSPQPDYDTAGAVFNVPTQGYAERFQQVGLLVAQGGSPLSANPERTLVPLYGRRISARRDKWNYYSRTDGLNPVQVPIRYKNRDCDEDNGCDELYDGDEVSVPALGQTFKANIYKQKNLVYNPFA